MIIPQQLKIWFAKFRKYTVKYKDGFFHLYNLANTPYTIIESLDKMPFIKHSRKERLIQSNTPFIHARLQYAQLEEGLWVMLSDMVFKKNVVIHNLYDDSIPVNFNLMNLHYNEKKLPNKSLLLNGMILTDKTWSVFKSSNSRDGFRFKGSHELNITVYFTDEWLASQPALMEDCRNSNLDRFLKSDNAYLLLKDMQLDSDGLYKTFQNLVKENRDDSKKEELKKQVTDYFRQFITIYNREAINDHYFNLPDKDRKYIQKAERCLLDNLFHSFPGIEYVSQKVGVSPTKLKQDFKIVHNQTLYHYYRYHQMHVASKLLTEKASTVKEVAHLLGYENASKFSAAFKDQFGLQPSALVKEIVK
jgi:AraC-like DNA-binding protein